MRIKKNKKLCFLLTKNLKTGLLKKDLIKNLYEEINRYSKNRIG